MSNPVNNTGLTGAAVPPDGSAPAPTANNRGGGGRGRGGRGFAPSTRPAAPERKIVPVKLNPSSQSDVEFSKEDGILKDAFVFVLLGANGLPQQYTFHHPIGVTKLDPSEWCATPSDEIKWLKARVTSPAIKAWESQMDLQIRALALSKGVGRTKDQNSVELWSQAKDVGSTTTRIKEYQVAAKAAGKPEGEWLAFAPAAVQASESLFRQFSRDSRLKENYEKANARPSHETKGGPDGTISQKALAYLGTLSPALAQDAVLARVLGRSPDGTDDTAAPPTAKVGKAATAATGFSWADDADAVLKTAQEGASSRGKKATKKS